MRKSRLNSPSILKKIVEQGEVSDDMISFLVNGYACTIREDDLFKDPSGEFSINKKHIFKDVIDAENVQTERFDYILVKILRNLPNFISKVPRRMSLSIKRPKDQSVYEDVKEEKTSKSEEESDPSSCSS